MRQAFLGLGGNIGDTLSYLREAVLALESEAPDGAVEVAAVSSVYETEPIGGPEQDVFLNIVVEIKTSLEPHDLLEFCLGLEQATGRVRPSALGASNIGCGCALDGRRGNERG